MHGMVPTQLWHDTLLAVDHALLTSGVGFPFALEPLSNTAVHLLKSHLSAHAVRGRVVSKRWTHVRSWRFRGVTSTRRWHDTLLAVGHALRTSGVGVIFVLEPLSNTAG